MGKRYYCDYCDKMMSSAPSIIKTHNNGFLHQKAKLEHFQKFKDPETILEEESHKKPCSRFPNGQCQFGSICRYSHYSSETLHSLQRYVSAKHLANTMITQPCFQDLYHRLQSEKSTARDGQTVLVDENGVTHTLPWSYNLTAEGVLPPSIRPITVEHFKHASFSEWG